MNIVLHLDKSSSAQLHFETTEGERVASIEKLFQQGFTIRPDDVPAALTLLAKFVRDRDEQRM